MQQQQQLYNSNSSSRIRKLPPTFHTGLRRCTSADPPEALEQGYCRLGNEYLDYQEIRIYTQNWVRTTQEKEICV
jgi:hypothetical protein